MKKLVKYLIFAVVFFTFSCKEDYSYEFNDVGSDFNFTSRQGYTSLDEDGTILRFITVPNNLTEVKIQKEIIDGLDVSTVDISTATFTNDTILVNVPYSNLGKGTSHIKCSAVFNGTTINRRINITCGNPFSVEAPVVRVNSGIFNMPFAIAPLRATVSGVTVATKKIHETYVDVAGPWDAIDTLAINSAGFVAGDTIVVKVTATAGTLSDFIETEIPVLAAP